MIRLDRNVDLALPEYCVLCQTVGEHWHLGGWHVTIKTRNTPYLLGRCRTWEGLDCLAGLVSTVVPLDRRRLENRHLSGEHILTEK